MQRFVQLFIKSCRNQRKKYLYCCIYKERILQSQHSMPLVLHKISTKMGSYMDNKMNDGKAVFSLRKSRMRRKVLEYLISIHPAQSYPSEIARKIRISSTDVCGALNGVPNRFREENSLVSLGLVERTEENDGRRYGVTERGCRMWKLLNKETYD